MGCNTSKESVQPAPNEAENSQTTAESKGIKEEQTESKSDSAKTVTLTSNGALLSGVDSGSSENKVGNGDQASDDKDIEQAATKIQAAFRGHKTRKSMKQPGKQEETEPTPQQLEEEFRADDTELCHAAVKIQASFRGHMIRKEMEKKKETEPTTGNKKNEAEEEELDIDLSDPDLNKAAVKIQASFRGHMVRKEHENEASNETK